MRFDFCIGNPPYQGDNHQQLYPDFFQAAKDIAGCIEMIFPVGWQQPKNANNLAKMNTKEVKEDKQIVLIDNVHNVFPGVSGAEWTNVIIWKKGYDNGLHGKQRLLINGMDENIVLLSYDKYSLNKPEKIRKLYEFVFAFGHFVSVSTITSVRKPYGLSTDVIVDKGGFLGTDKYGLKPLQLERKFASDIKVYCKGGILRYIPLNYALPKKTVAFNKFKVFVPYAWGNMSEKVGLGGAYSNIILGLPNEICTESYLESGCFDSYEMSVKHAKYLMTKFLRALLYLNKYSQHSTTAWGAVPLQDYHEDFWNGTIADIDVALMDKYNVPSDIREFIFSHIQTRSESNIVNFRKE